jgi:osmoprotectant transport system permease protein
VVSLVALFALGLMGPRLARSLDRSTTTTQTEHPAETKVQAAAHRPLVVGAKTFSEQYILQDAITLQLKNAGIASRSMGGLGSTVAFDALVAGEIDVYVDYSGTIWANHMKQTKTMAPWIVQAKISSWLAETHGVRVLGALGFENAYALAMRESQAAEFGVTSIQDLTAHAPKLRIGGDYEFFGRQEWRDLVSTYGLKFADRLTLDSTLMYGAVSRGEVDVISAFSSDGRIAAMNLRVLADNRHAMPPYDALILLSPQAATRSDVVDALSPLIGAIPVRLMQQANFMVDRDEDKKTVREAAEWLLENAGL